VRVALLSDVHANLTALDAVLAALPRVEEIWVMGDTVGYGPDPSEVIARLHERRAHLVAGNHDRAVATGEGLELFNPIAAEAAVLHRAWLSADEIAVLERLPLTLTRAEATLFHGSLRQPLWEYIFDSAAAAATLSLAPTSCSVCGHTHVPALFRLVDGIVQARAVRPGETYPLGPAASRSVSEVPRGSPGKVLINPGSVGQPRDRDPRASWALLDTETGVRFQRTAYDVGATQRRMRARHLPDFLIERLAIGL
jgi:diadenosine tetraphosphatase ApaH/serine/threonine PP2A family protein phosphatase